MYIFDKIPRFVCIVVSASFAAWAVAPSSSVGQAVPTLESLPTAWVEAIAKTNYPDEVPVLPPRVLSTSCDDRGLGKILHMIDAGRLSDRPGTFVLVQKAASCRWLGRKEGRGIAVHYQSQARDPVGLATVARTFSGLGRNDYRSFARSYLASLIPNGMPLNIQTSALALDIAAGACAPVLTRACLVQALRENLPAQWRMDDDAALAFGDLFNAPLPLMTCDAMVAAVSGIERSALPIRSDLLVQVQGLMQKKLEASRNEYYEHAFGMSEVL